MYTHPDDLHRARSVGAAAAPEFEAWLAFQKAVDREDGAVPRRYRELISVAVALVTQCAYCLDVHTAAARRHGVTAEELAETAFVTASVRAGGTLAHALLADRLYEQHGHHAPPATPASAATPSG
ncbi:carboxymuconolactone decarboxylase family protein [Streptomyces lavendulae]|uniref:carboxymuconolactone decarboxylase family protein n=1 Tax=Streptomyces lavendulae TaxID=1914 RepID=UPI0024A27FDA|nr:carboxymuconolactone decarboxylase family protein [Streptomyces lavendulae]GLX23185.1 alkyl hydroperoxide reductase AhpD [Streptomyces lavendulae subsp. lavendulae]GLX30647.1 alkyl hydroperoxide reductase AhpD [Streptomyces lavendulae subsp. lavendulae]